MVNFKGKYILVTGADGFIGSHLVVALQDLGASVFAIDKKSNLAVQDINKMKDLKQLDYIFHFGSPSSNNLFSDDDKSQEIDTIGSLMRVIELAKKYNAHLVVPSTSSVYAKEINNYAKVKLFTESLISYFKVKATILRIFAGYGIGEDNKGNYASIIFQFCVKALKNETINVYGDGKQSRDYIYINDVVTSIIHMAGNVGIFDIGTGVNTSTKDVLNIIEKIHGQSLKISYMDAPPNFAKSIKCKDPINALVTVEDGIKRTYEYVKKNLHKLKGF